MNKETIYFNCSEPGEPIFPHLYEQVPGPSCSREVIEDLSDDDSDMDEEDVKAMFEVEAHEQHVDALEDDSDLDAEEMARNLESDGDGGEDDEEEFDPQQGNFSDLVRTSLCFPPQCQLGSCRVSFQKAGRRSL